MNRCEQAKASRLLIDLPVGYDPEYRRLEQYGFDRERMRQKAYVYVDGKDGSDLCRSEDWSVNNAHVGLYQRS